MTVHTASRFHARAVALAAVLAALTLPHAALAQANPNPALADTQNEAPGAHPLAPMPPEHTDALQGSPAGSPAGSPSDPSAERSMAFSSSGGGPVCRETVPGGPMLAVAYAIALLVMGAYVALLARKNARLASALNDLESELNRRRAPGAGDRSEG